MRKVFGILVVILLFGGLGFAIYDEGGLPEKRVLPDKVEFERAIFDEVNRVRVENGLKPTEWSDILYEKAQESCTDMVEAQDLVHHDMYSPWAENCYGGALSYLDYREETVEPVYIVERWYNSPLHKIALLKDNIKHSAVAISFDNGFWVAWSFPGFGEPVGYSPWLSQSSATQ